MKQLIILFLLPITVYCQTIDPAVQKKVNTVENSLAPSIIFGNTMLKLNIEKRMKETTTQEVGIAVIQDY